MDSADLIAAPEPDRSARSQTLLLVLGSAAFSLSYVALAVLAWGWRDWRGFFESAPRAGVSIGMFLLFVGTFAFGCNVSTGRRDHPANNWIFLPMLLVGLALGWFPPHDDRLNRWPLGGWPVAWGGLALFLAGTFLRVGAVRVMGPRHSVWVAVQQEHELLTTGLYRWIRHPSYLGALLAVFGWALAFRSGIGLLLAGLMVPPILSRIRAEESLLIDEFGDEYRRYQRRTRRLLPILY